MQAFIIQKGGSALVFYDDISDATSVARVTFLLIQSLLGDSVIVSSLRLSTLALISIPPKIWRLYVVYGNRFLGIIPALLLITSYTGKLFNLGSRVVTLPSHSTLLTEPSSGRFFRHLIHS